MPRKRVPKPRKHVPDLLQQRNQQRELEQMRQKIQEDCGLKFKAYLDGQRDYYHVPEIDYWRQFVNDFYDSNAVERLCVAHCRDIRLCEDKCIDAKGYLSRCEICNMTSQRAFEATTKSLPRLLESKYRSGLISDVISCEGTRQDFLPDGNFLVECLKTRKDMRFKDFSIVHEGTLRMVFNKDNAKILSWQFCAKSVQVCIPSHRIPKELSAGPITTTTRSVPITDEGFKQYAALLDVKIDSHIDRYGLPRSYHRCFMFLEGCNRMKDLMSYSYRKGLGPFASLSEYYAKPRQN